MVKRRTLRDEQRPVGTDEEADDRQSAVLIAGRGAGEGKIENLNEHDKKKKMILLCLTSGRLDSDLWPLGW